MKKTLIIALSLLLTACEQAPATWHPDSFAFESPSIAPININVAEIKIVEGYRSPMRKPNVEQEFPTAPANAVKSWVNHRLRATGTSGVLEVTINDAAVKETPLKKTEGVKGLFTDDQDARYDAHLAVTFRAYSGATGRAMSDASGSVEITRFQTINEKATVTERQQMYDRMTKDIMASFDTEAQNRLRQYFGAFLK